MANESPPIAAGTATGGPQEENAAGNTSNSDSTPTTPMWNPPDDTDDGTERAAVAAMASQYKLYERARRIAKDEADAEDAKANGLSGTWGRVDPLDALEAAANPRIAEVGQFQQTSTEPPHGVFYKNCLNEVHGESESGKSLLVLYVVAQELLAGHGVVYVDYESDEADVYGRLLNLMGVSRQLLEGDLFRYHKPNGPMTPIEKVQFAESVTMGGSTVVFDGVTEGMSLEGLSGRDEQDVARWHSKITKQFAHAGWCVICIDHTPHDSKRTLGSQHKRAAIGGVSYLVEQVHPIGVGQRGVLRLRVDKDRSGSVRREAAPGKRPQYRGDLVVDWQNGQVPDIRLFNVTAKNGEAAVRVDMLPDREVCWAIVQYVENNPGCSSGDIEDAVKTRKNKLLRAKNWMVDRGHLRTEPTGNKQGHYLTDLELSDDAFET